jgi:hypothetical protein
VSRLWIKFLAVSSFNQTHVTFTYDILILCYVYYSIISIVYYYTCGYCIASHGAAARKAGMSEAMFGELMAVVGMANETNRLANGYRVPVDAAFE